MGLLPAFLRKYTVALTFWLDFGFGLYRFVTRIFCFSCILCLREHACTQVPLLVRIYVRGRVHAGHFQIVFEVPVNTSYARFVELLRPRASRTVFLERAGGDSASRKKVERSTLFCLEQWITALKR